MKIYDQQFNQNEWFVLIVLISIYILVFLLPKRYPPTILPTFLLLGFYIGMLSDHSISIPPFDYYDVNDNSYYEFFDFLTYVMYGPFGYLLVYLYDYFKIRGYQVMVYIIIWTIVAMILEYIGVKFGVFHYKNGYKMIFSIPIYLLFLSLTLIYYQLVKHRTAALNVTIKNE